MWQRRAMPIVLVALNIAVFGWFVLRLRVSGPSVIGIGAHRVDLDVYRLGSRQWLDGGQLYGALPPTASGATLLFTYPPTAAVLMIPLVLLGSTASSVLMVLASVAALAVTMRLMLDDDSGGDDCGDDDSGGCGDADGGPRRRRWLLAAAVPVGVLLEPMRGTLGDGQINALLMAAVALDCLGLPGRRSGPGLAVRQGGQGWLVGLAAAVKLTPAIFVLYLVLSGNRRAARNAVLTFVAVSGAAAVIDPVTSARYWTRIVFQTGRIGPAQFTANQSVLGVLARAGLSGTPRTALWLLLSLGLLMLCVRAVRAAVRRRQQVLALVVTAVTGLLISPISWSHHWVWAEPALLALLGSTAVGGLPRWRSVACGAGCALLAIGPQWLLPHGADRELRWALWQQVVGAGYPLAGLALLLVAAASPDIRGWHALEEVPIEPVTAVRAG